jgi:hypothetical protein
MKRALGATRGVGPVAVAIGLLSIVMPDPLPAEVMAGTERWQGDEGECLTLPSDPVKAENVRRLALVLLGSYGSDLGCVTFPYLGAPYNIAGNKAHAGIDFRANDVPVMAAEAGVVRKVMFCDPAKTKGCDPAAGSSTLIIENNGRTRKTLYLHMLSIDVARGDYVFAGQTVGTAGSVGADAAHLHFEVWPEHSPLYCTRERSISGSACADAESTCSLERIRDYTESPEGLMKHPDNTPKPKRSTPSVSYANAVTLNGIGPIKVGVSLWESLKDLDELILGDDDYECSMVKLQSADCGLWVMVSRGRVMRVDVTQGNYRTDEGIGIGSTETAVKKAFGTRLKSRPNQYTEGARDVWVEATVNGRTHSMLFEIDGGKVVGFRAGEADAVSWVEGCN